MFYKNDFIISARYRPWLYSYQSTACMPTM